MFSLITPSGTSSGTQIINFFRLTVKALLYACKMQLKNTATVYVTESESRQLGHSSVFLLVSGDILTRELICSCSESFPLMSRRAPGEGRPGGFI